MISIQSKAALLTLLALLSFNARAVDPSPERARCAELWQKTEAGHAKPEELWALCSAQRSDQEPGLRFRAASVGKWSWIAAWGGLTPEALAERDKYGNSLLHAVAFSEPPGATLFLRDWIKAGGSVDPKSARGATPLRYALSSPSKKAGDAMASALIQAGADRANRRDDGDSLMHYVASEGSPQEAELLGASKASLAEETKTGARPLDIAIAKDNAPMVEWLVKRGAPLEGAKSPAPIFLAAGKPHALDALLKAAPGEANRKGEGGQSPLHAAVMAEGTPGDGASNDALATGALLKAGAKPDAPDARGITPLMLAVAQGKPASALRLLAAGANPCAKDQQGFPAWRMSNSLNAAESLKALGHCSD